MCKSGEHMTCEEDCKVIQSKCPEGMDYEMRCLHVENLLEEEVKRRIKAVRTSQNRFASNIEKLIIQNI